MKKKYRSGKEQKKAIEKAIDSLSTQEKNFMKLLKKEVFNKTEWSYFVKRFWFLFFQHGYSTEKIFNDLNSTVKGRSCIMKIDDYFKKNPQKREVFKFDN